MTRKPWSINECIITNLNLAIWNINGRKTGLGESMTSYFFILLGRVAEVSSAHPWKASSPISVTLYSIPS